MTALLVFAVLAAIFGLFNLTPATTGVGCIALAAFLAVCARIAQARQPATSTASVADQTVIPPPPGQERALYAFGAVLAIFAIGFAIYFGTLR